MTDNNSSSTTSVHSAANSGAKSTSRSPAAEVIYALLHDKLALFGIVLVTIFILAAVFAPLIAPQNPYDLAQLDIMDGRLQPGSESMSGMTYLLGTDTQGRDLFSAILYGLRTSILVGLSSAAIALVIGASIGLTSAYVGGRTDSILMRIVDIQLSFPAILIALIFPALRQRRTRIPATLGALLSVLATPFVPAGMPVLFSLLGLLSWRERKDAK